MNAREKRIAEAEERLKDLVTTQAVTACQSILRTEQEKYNNVLNSDEALNVLYTAKLESVLKIVEKRKSLRKKRDTLTRLINEMDKLIPDFRL